MDQPRQADRRSSEDHGNVVLMSLYLLLVAFFVLLNSMAQFEEFRVEEAMGSVKSEFRKLFSIDCDSCSRGVTAGQPLMMMNAGPGSG